MADEKATAAVPAAATAAKPASAAEPAVAVRYSYEELRDASNAFGYGPEVMDGAFYGKDKNKAYTVKEARDAVEAFLKRPVKEAK